MAEIDPSWFDDGQPFVLTPEIEQQAKETISRYKAHLKFYGINPAVDNTREGDRYTTKLAAHDGFSRKRMSATGVSDISQDFALLFALEDFYKLIQEN